MKRLAPLFFVFCAALAAQEQSGAASNEPSLTWKVVNFVLLAAGLGYLMIKNLPAVFESRTTSIQKGIAESQAMKAAAEKRAAAVDARVSALGAEIEKFRIEAKGEMELEGERIRRETGYAIAKLEQQAQGEIEAAGKSASRELKIYAANLALDLAEQRIRTRVDTGTEAALVDNFVSDLRRQESKN
jgi:F-type H+-transporting ATPase subunit b